MKKKLIQILWASMLMLMLVLSGCQNKKEEPKADVNAEGEEEADYTDKVFDKKAIEGKFSIFFLRSDYEYKGDSSVQHSGDSSLLIAPDGTTMLIDLNTANNSAVIVSALQNLGIDTIDYLVISHPHLDHMGGYPLVFRYMTIKNIIMNPYEPTGNALYSNFVKEAQERNIPIVHYREGASFLFGNEISVKVYNPMLGNEDYSNAGKVNGSSLLMKFTYKDSTFLAGGDTYTEQERALVEKYGDELQADVVKMNHHARASSNCREFVKTVKPKIAGAHMSSVMSDTIMTRYLSAGAITLHTALDGTFVIYTDGDGTYDVQLSRERFTTEYGSLDSAEGHLRVE